MSPRVKVLLEYLATLDPDKRHEIVLICRGNEPWTIKERVTESAIDLKPTPKIK